jgi:hypothetical protein
LAVSRDLKDPSQVFLPFSSILDFHLKSLSKRKALSFPNHLSLSSFHEYSIWRKEITKRKRKKKTGEQVTKNEGKVGKNKSAGKLENHSR